jgi:hypothetical protein
MTHEMTIPSACLWRARLAWLHDQMLDACTSDNQAIVFKNYQEFFTLIKDTDCPKVMLSTFYVEHSHVLLHYYKYNESISAITLAQETINLKLNFTGKLGMRTKYQTFLTP